MNSFSVTSAAYDGSSTSTNPLVMVQGALNGVYANCLLFWDCIQQTNNAGGISAVQNLIAVGFLNYVEPFKSSTPTIPFPAVPASVSPLPNSGNAAYQNSVCTQAMVGSWTA